MTNQRWMVVFCFPLPSLIFTPFPRTSSEIQPCAGLGKSPGKGSLARQVRWPKKVTIFLLASQAEPVKGLMSTRHGPKKEEEEPDWERSRQKGPPSWQQWVELPQLHPQRKECEKGQSKQNSSKVLKVLVEHADRGRQTWLGYDDLLFFTLTLALGHRKSCWELQPQREMEEEGREREGSRRAYSGNTDSG